MEVNFLNEKFSGILLTLLHELDISKQILNEVKENGRFSDSKKLISHYERLFLSEPLSQHIEFKIAFVGKSTHSLIVRYLDEDNANRHITLDLVSSDSIWIDQLYDNRISDLLKFFKHLFSAIENYAIYQNKRKLEKFENLIEQIKNDIEIFLKINIEADNKQIDLLVELKQKEELEIRERVKGIQLKSNWQLYVNVILDNGIEYLYHFTDITNIDSIKQAQGLYSWAFSDLHKIAILRPGGDELSRNLDKRKGVENYVRLSFCKNHPMEYVAKKEGRIKNSVKLLCDTELIYHVGTKYCNMNATKNEAIISDNIEYFQNINFGVCKRNYLDLTPIEKSQYQSEVLAYEHVPMKYIHNLNDL
ncbi:MAG: DUF4433 domain-containing protein [Crocinitomix sp.]|nr:DUF4433 domain-containing protein [Crocinitomix sp.]